MGRLRIFASRLRGMLRKRRMDAELDEELRTHLELLADDYRRQGMDPAEARRAARLRLGGAEQIKEAVRDQRGLPRLESVAQDLGYAARSLSKSPAFALATVITLGLGIGANIAIFAVVNGLLLQPLPFPEPDRLVYVEDHLPEYPNGMPVSFPNFVDWSERQGVFEAVALYQRASLALTGGGDPERLDGARVTADLLTALGVPPAVGRSFDRSEDRPGAERVALVSHGLWQERFGGEPLLGQALVLDGVPHTVIGIMPSGFRFPEDARIWVPLAVDPAVYPRDRHSFEAIARLRPGVTLEQAQVEMDAVAGQLAEQYPDSNEGLTLRLRPGREGLVPTHLGSPFLLLLGAVGLVLLIASANAANLMLTRSTTRSQELAMREALGAGRGRLMQQLLFESLLLATLGSVLGLAVGRAGRDLILELVPGELPSWIRFDLDLRVALFAVLLVALTTILTGLLPGLRASRTDLAAALQESGSHSSTDSSGALRKALVVAEVALALTLLVAAGLLLRSFAQVLEVDPGFRSENVLALRFTLTDAKYPEAGERRAFLERALETAAGLPGTRRAGAVSSLPMGDVYTSMSVTGEGAVPLPSGADPSVGRMIVTPGYFETMGIDLLGGRLFDRRDGRSDTPPVALASALLAKRLWPDADPVGRRIKLGDLEDDVPWMEIVGVVEDVRQFGLTVDVEPTLYVPYQQQPAAKMTLVVETEAGAPPLADPLRRALWAMDPDLPITGVWPMDDLVRRTAWRPRVLSWFLAAFAFVALSLAAVGVYGVISYSVALRTREIGLRMALGADRGEVQRMVVRQGLALTAIGLVVGIAASAGLAHMLRSLLHGVSPADPPSFAIGTFVLLAAAWLACVEPARRAAGIEPMTSLRTD